MSGTFLSSVSHVSHTNSISVASRDVSTIGTGYNLSTIRRYLPVECQANKYPIVLLQHAYDPHQLTKLSVAEGIRMLEDLEADLLLECCRFGKIVRLISPEGGHPLLEGSVAITYHTKESADSCAAALNGRWFDGRQLLVEILYPNSEGNDADEPFDIAESKVEITSIEHRKVKSIEVVNEKCHMSAVCAELKTNADLAPDQAIPAADDDDVDDFLKSLL